MCSGSERMHTWRRTPSTGRNFQTLIIWITVSKKASCNGSISVNKFQHLYPLYILCILAMRNLMLRQKQMKVPKRRCTFLTLNYEKGATTCFCA